MGGSSKIGQSSVTYYLNYHFQPGSTALWVVEDIFLVKTNFKLDMDASTVLFINI